MRRYGFFLNVLPGDRIKGIAERPFLREALMAAARRDDVDVVVVAPPWFQRQVRDWLKHAGLARGKVSVLRSPRSPVSLHAFGYLRKFNESAIWREAIRKVRTLAQRAAHFARRRPLLFGGALTGFAILGAIVILLACMLISPLIVAIFLFGAALLMAGMYLLRRRLVRLLRRILTLSRSTRMRGIYRKLIERHFNALTEIANDRAAVDAWLVLNPYAFGAKALTAPTVTLIPDFLPLEDPLAYSDVYHQAQHLKVMAMLDGCAGIICHDANVRDRHLIYGAGLPRERIKVIPEGRTNLPTIFDPAVEANNARVLCARQIIRPFQRSALGHRLVYTRVDLARDSFILYAGDSAPHHHCLVLLRALKQHNSTQGQPLRLVLRRELISYPMIEHWLDREGPELAPYVVGLDDEAPLTWAALNVLARCAVDPSLFAPSFPRTFAEAVSAWTPILMSHIPAVTNIIQDPALRKDMLFDPYDSKALAARLDWVLKNRNDLARRQRDVFEMLPTWGKIGDRVFETMVEVAAKKDLVQ